MELIHEATASLWIYRSASYSIWCVPVAVAELRWRWRQKCRAGAASRTPHGRRLPQFVPQRGQVLQRPADGLNLERLLVQLEAGGNAGAAARSAAAAAVVVAVDAAVRGRGRGGLRGTGIGELLRLRNWFPILLK